ncbi:MAG: CDP-archaeol synthase [Myxococcales bacterium]|nr:CDP-archaeol synthase [Myxococcales bacterium]
MNDLLGTAYLFLPLLGGGLFHGLAMKYDWFAFLRRPIDGGRAWRGVPIFGANKTWRGPVALGIGSALVMGAQSILAARVTAFRGVGLVDYAHLNGWAWGFALGFAAMLAELPNSFAKRRLGVGPGEARGGAMGALLYVADQIDLLAGAWIVLAFLVDVTVSRVLWSATIVALAHQGLTLFAHATGMRASAR